VVDCLVKIIIRHWNIIIVVDTAYTERYLGLATSDDNSIGYDVSVAT